MFILQMNGNLKPNKMKSKTDLDQLKKVLWGELRSEYYNFEKAYEIFCMALDKFSQSQQPSVSDSKEGKSVEEILLLTLPDFNDESGEYWRGDSVIRLLEHALSVSQVKQNTSEGKVTAENYLRKCGLWTNLVEFTMTSERLANILTEFSQLNAGQVKTEMTDEAKKDLSIAYDLIARLSDICKEFKKESVVIDTLNDMATQSLSPEVFAKWEEVKDWLIKTRKI